MIIKKIFIRIESTVDNYLDWFENFERYHPKYLTILFVGICCWLLSILFFFSPTLLYRDTHPRLDDFIAQCSDPFTRTLNEPILSFRIIVPAIARLLGLNGAYCLLLQYLPMVITLSIIYAAMRKRVDASKALLSTIAISFTWLTFWTNSYPGYSDSFTHLMVSICLLYPYKILFLLMCILGTLNDERFIIVIPFIILWHNNWKKFEFDTKKLFVHAMVFSAGVLMVVIIRQALLNGFIGPGFEEPLLYRNIKIEVIKSFRPYASNWLLFVYNVIFSFRWAWLLPFFFLIKNYKYISYQFKILFFLSIFFSALSTAVVMDVARSICFTFPILMISASAINDKCPSFIKKILIISILLNIITPTVIFNGKLPAAVVPLPIELVNYAVFMYTGNNLYIDILYNNVFRYIFPRLGNH